VRPVPVRFLVAAFLVLFSAALANAQPLRGVVVDQTGLPLPGVTIHVRAGASLVYETQTDADGRFSIERAQGLTVTATLDGFEPATVAATDAERITLSIARAAESTTVTATLGAETTPTALGGGTLTSTAVARLPSSHMHARESLPLLPSVIRGADGLLQLGGARAYQTPLTLDGFNVTDPATGLSSVNLPLEAVLGVNAIRDPMAVTYGDLLGGLVRMESRPGGAMPRFGLQGFVPRPRFTSPGFGRIEGIFPRAHVAGTAREGRVQYALAGEYDYERIPVPQVTDQTGRDLIEESGIAFSRVDVQVTPRNALTVEAYHVPADTRWYGLSPRRQSDASVSLASTDTFAGISDRHLTAAGGIVTVRLGALSRGSSSRPNGSGVATLAPSGWRDNWFAEWSRASRRLSGSVGWDQPTLVRGSLHEFGVTAELSAVRTSGQVAEREIQVRSSAGALLRHVGFAGPSTLSASDTTASVALRDVWHLHPRAEVDAGVRVDTSLLAPAVPSARVGLRYMLDDAGRTTVKAGIGRFVGALPLVTAMIAQYPVRTDSWFDEATGEQTRQLVFTPTPSTLARPRARTIVAGIEREIVKDVDVQVIATMRTSSSLPTLVVPTESGPLRVDDHGTSTYRELQFAARRVLPHDQQVFVSYVHASAIGELNEVATQTIESPLLEPGGRARSSNDARHRVLAWGTLDLPSRVVVSPAIEWHSGFTYSERSSRYTYVGTPNSRTFPAFFSLDLVTYRTITVRGFDVDLGVQVFNLTNHWNPRDVFPVVGEPGFGQFANSVPRILRGYMLLKW